MRTLRRPAGPAHQCTRRVFDATVVVQAARYALFINFLKYLTLSFKCLLVYLSRLYHLLVILVLYLTLHYPCLITSLLYLNLASLIFVISGAFVTLLISLLLKQLLLLLFILVLITAIHSSLTFLLLN